MLLPVYAVTPSRCHPGFSMTRADRVERINCELGANFDLYSFRHVAVWNCPRSRMEMYLQSSCPRTVSIKLPGLQVTFAEGERIHTENSYKYTHAMVRSLLQDGGFEMEHTWTDRRKWFALHRARHRLSGGFMSCEDILFDRGDEVTVQAGDGGIRFLLVSGRPIEEPVAGMVRL